MFAPSQSPSTIHKQLNTTSTFYISSHPIARMSSSSAMPTRDSNLSHFSNYPTWKVDLWRQISKDAKTRGAFLPEHYDNDGFLKHDLESYKGLFQWWLRQKDAATYQYLVPMWEHHRHGRWELYLVDTDAWTPVVALDAEKAIAGKAGARRKLPAGGMTINGLEPRCVSLGWLNGLSLC